MDMTLLCVLSCLLVASTNGDNEIFHNREERESWKDDCINTVLRQLNSSSHQDIPNGTLSCHRPYNYDTPCYLTSYCVEANGANWTAHDVCEAIARITVPMTQRMVDLGSCAREDINIISGDVMYREKHRDPVTREFKTKHQDFHWQVRQSWWDYFSIFVQLLTNTIDTMPKRIHLMVNVETCNRTCAWAQARHSDSTTSPIATAGPSSPPVLSQWDVLREKQRWKNECPNHIVEEWMNWIRQKSVSMPSGCVARHTDPCILSARCREVTGQRWTVSDICQVVSEVSHMLTQLWLEVDNNGCLDEDKNDFITDVWYTEQHNGTHLRESHKVGRHYEWTVQNVRWDFYSAILSFLLNAFISKPNNFYIEMQIRTCNSSCAWGAPPATTIPVTEAPVIANSTTDFELRTNWQPICDGSIGVHDALDLLFDNCHKHNNTCGRRSLYCVNNTLRGDVMDEPALCLALYFGLYDVADFDYNMTSCQNPPRINITFSFVVNGEEISQLVESVSDLSQVNHLPKRLLSIIAECNTPGVTAMTLTGTINPCMQCSEHHTHGTSVTQVTPQLEPTTASTITTEEPSSSTTIAPTMMEPPGELWTLLNYVRSNQPVCNDQNITYDSFIRGSFRKGWPSRCKLKVNLERECQPVTVICHRKRDNFWPASEMCNALTWATVKLARFLSPGRYCNNGSAISLNITKEDRDRSQAVIADEWIPEAHETTLDTLSTYTTRYFETEQTYNLKQFKLRAEVKPCRPCPISDITSEDGRNHSEHIQGCHRMFHLEDIVRNRQKYFDRGCFVIRYMFACLQRVFDVFRGGFSDVVPYIDVTFIAMRKKCPRKLRKVYKDADFD